MIADAPYNYYIRFDKAYVGEGCFCALRGDKRVSKSLPVVGNLPPGDSLYMPSHTTMAASKGKGGSRKDKLKSVEPEPNAFNPVSTLLKDEAKPEAEAGVKEVKTTEAKAEEVEAGKLETSEALKNLNLGKVSKPETSENIDKGHGNEEAERPQRPPRPERRTSAFTSNLNELCVAFPEAARGTCRGLLVAASNNLEAAFMGMLAISDESIRPASYIREQIAHDERLARRLAMNEQRPRREPHARPRPREYNYDEEDSNTGEELYDGFQRGLDDTKQAVSSFWSSIKSKINGEIYDDEEGVHVATAPRKEHLRSQWFPRQHPNPQPDSGAAAPKLPTRKLSRAEALSVTGASNILSNASKLELARREPRSVNAFGDETPKAGQRSDEPEPDAFFIGESDDDLGSLNDDLESEIENPIEKISKKAEGANSSPDAYEASEGEKKDETKSAKDMLAKFETNANKLNES